MNNTEVGICLGIIAESIKDTNKKMVDDNDEEGIELGKRLLEAITIAQVEFLKKSINDIKKELDKAEESRQIFDYSGDLIKRKEVS